MKPYFKQKLVGQSHTVDCNTIYVCAMILTQLKKAYSTKYSQAVTHPSTNLAQCCLTSVIRRELVFSTWYGRRQDRRGKLAY